MGHTEEVNLPQLRCSTQVRQDELDVLWLKCQTVRPGEARGDKSTAQWGVAAGETCPG